MMEGRARPAGRGTVISATAQAPRPELAEGPSGADPNLPCGPWLVMASLAVALSALALALPENHDVAWLLHVGGQILDGARPYRDVFEINPPPAVGLEASIAVLARLLRVRALGLHAVLVVTACLASAGTALRLAKRQMGSWRLAMLGVGALAALLALPGGGLGQRDHLGLVLLLPYLTALGLGESLSLPLVVLAAVGVALKPHLLLVALAAELAQPPGSRAHVARLLGVLGVLALLSVLAAPSYLPFAIRYGPAYAAFIHIPRGYLLFHPYTLLILTALGLGFVLRPRQEGRLFWTYFAAAVGGLASVFVQAKGLGYHYVPAGGLSVMALAAAFAARAPGRKSVLWLGALAVVVAGIQFYRAAPVHDVFKRDVPELERALNGYRHASILGLTWSLKSGFPLTNDLGLRWCSPYSSFWAVTGGIAAGRMDLVRETLDRTIASANPRPDLILLDAGRGGPPPYIRLRRFLSRDLRFRELLTHYRVLRVVGRYEILELQPDQN